MLLSACRLARLRQQAAGGCAGVTAVAASARAGARAISSTPAGALRLQLTVCLSKFQSITQHSFTLCCPEFCRKPGWHR
jgi:hypothetical protein